MPRDLVELIKLNMVVLQSLTSAVLEVLHEVFYH